MKRDKGIIFLHLRHLRREEKKTYLLLTCLVPSGHKWLVHSLSPSLIIIVSTAGIIYIVMVIIIIINIIIIIITDILIENNFFLFSLKGVNSCNFLDVFRNTVPDYRSSNLDHFSAVVIIRSLGMKSK